MWINENEYVLVPEEVKEECNGCAWNGKYNTKEQEICVALGRECAEQSKIYKEKDNENK